MVSLSNSWGHISDFLEVALLLFWYHSHTHIPWTHLWWPSVRPGSWWWRPQHPVPRFFAESRHECGSWQTRTWGQHTRLTRPACRCRGWPCQRSNYSPPGLYGRKKCKIFIWLPVKVTIYKTGFASYRCLIHYDVIIDFSAKILLANEAYV